jgi:phosphoglycerol transferase MdoB-like AlkP superfamily enzyme
MTGTAQNKRVIMIQVESLANFPIGNSINGQEITPNLNTLLGDSHYFTDHRYVIGAGHTSDTDFVVNSSIYPLYDSSAFVRYGRDNFSGLPEVVGDSGYTTAAYHAYNRSFWNRDAAFNSLGYQRFYAAESYPRGTTYNINGLNDQSFLQKTLDYLEKEPENSLNFIITLSSHFPYKMDSNSSTLSLEGQNIPKVAGDYFQSIHYTDMAIGEFIEGLKNKGLYDDTLILIYGDHNAPYVEGFSIGDFVYDPYSLEGLRIPLIIKTPNQTTGLTHNKATTTLDIAPTILDLLGLKTDMPMFGESLFASDATSLPRCIGGEVIHIGAFVDCEAEIKAEKEIAAKIIKYNLFDTFRVR